MNPSRLALPLLAAVLALGPLAAQTPTAQGQLSLPDALRRAGQSNLQADLARFANTGVQQERKEVLASYLPEIKFLGGHLNTDNQTTLLTQGFQLGPYQMAPGLQIGPFSIPSMPDPIAQQASWRYQLTADYLIYDFGKRSSALQASTEKEKAVDLRGKEAVRRSQAEVAACYMAVLNIKARQKVVAQRQQALTDHLKDAKSLFDQGVVARNDLLRTEVALRGVVDADRTLADSLLSAQENLNVALGLPPGSPLALPETLGNVPPIPWNEPQIRARASENNDGVKALQSKVRATEEQTAYRKRDYMPNVVAELEHDYQQNQYMLHQQQTSLFLGVSWKIFDGGVRSAHLSQARAESDTARRELVEARRKAENAAASALRSFQEAVQETESANANVVSAQENLRIVRDQYQQGYAKGTDVLDAETVLAESRFSLADRKYRAYAQQSALLAILGEDLATFYASNLEH